MGSLETRKKFDSAAFKAGYMVAFEKTQARGAFEKNEGDSAVKFVVDALVEHPDDASRILGILDKTWEEINAKGITGQEKGGNDVFKRWERDAIIVELAARKTGANVNAAPQLPPKAATDTRKDVSETLGSV